MSNSGHILIAVDLYWTRVAEFISGFRNADCVLQRTCTFDQHFSSDPLIKHYDSVGLSVSSSTGIEKGGREKGKREEKRSEEGRTGRKERVIIRK